MDEKFPKLTLVWMYDGPEPEERRQEIALLEYPQMEVIVPDKDHSLTRLSDLMSIDSEVCIFWSDDGKPVASTFLKQMVRPLTVEDDAPAVMHLWSGNAVALRRATLESVQKGIFRLVGTSFMKLAIFFLEVGSESRGIRSQVAVSSTEQLAPLFGEVYGRVC